MRKLYLLLFTICCSLSSYAQMPYGIYEISGINSKHGSYIGKLQIIGQKIIRIVQFTDSNLETVWEGKIENDMAFFSLAATNVLTTFNDFTIPDEELKKQISLNIHLSDTVKFEAGRDGVYSENYTLTDLYTDKPLWINERTKLNARNDQERVTTKLMPILGIDKVFNWYHQEAPKQFGDLVKKTEYINHEAWQIFDPTDFNFYRENPSIIRVTNKTINPLSIAEAQMRHNAYAPTLTAKANYYDKEIVDLNLNDAGLLELVSVDNNGKKVGAYPEGDSCLWTGMYILSQVKRFEQTENPAALKNIQKAIRGLLTLTIITEDKTDFARTLSISPATESFSPIFVQGKGAYSHLKWTGNGNNDMSKGLIIGFASAYNILKEYDPDLFVEVREATKRLISFNGFTQSQINKGIANGLIALYSDSVDMDAIRKFKSGVFDIASELSYIFSIDSGIHWKSMVDMSGNHLAVTTTLGILIIAENFEKKFPPIIYNGFQINNLRNHYKKVIKKIDRDNRTGHRGYETIAAYAYTHDPSLKNDAENALWCLREIPAPRTIGNGIVDLKRLPDWSPSYWPIAPWEALSGIRKMLPNLDFKEFAQSAYGYPIFETMTWQTTYYWKENPYFAKYQSSPNIISFSSDYLVIYWLARSAGLIAIED